MTSISPWLPARRLCLTVLAVWAAAGSVAGTELSADEAFPPGDAPILRIENQNITVKEMAEVICTVTKWRIICTEQAGSVRFAMWGHNMLASEMLLAVSKAHGLACVIEGNVIYLMTKSEFVKKFGTTQEIVSLKYASADRVAAALQPFLTSGDAKVVPVQDAGAVIVYDTPGNLEHLRAIIAELDRPLDTTVVAFSNVSAGDVAKALQNLRSPGGKVCVDEPSNQLLLIDVPDRIKQMLEICGQLDLCSQRVTRRFRLKHADCARVAEHLKDMFGLTDKVTGRVDAPAPADRGEAAPQDPLGAQGISSLAKVSSKGAVVVEPRTNSLWVTESPERMELIAVTISGLDEALESGIYEFNYADPAEIEMDKKLSGVLTGPFDHYEVDRKTRRVSIAATPEKLESAIALLRRWDARPRQVLIAGRVLSVNVDTLRDIGITYDALVSQMDDNVDTAVRASGSFPPVVPGSPLGSLEIGDVGLDHFNILIEALESDSRTRLLSSPRVLVTDGDSAKFEVATEEPYTEVVLNSDTGTTSENVKFKNVGVVLTVTPHLGEGGDIPMQVTLDVSSVQEFRGGVPVVSRSSVTSQVLVGDGRPLVIGGLISDEDIKTVTRVPVLGSLPLLGALFRNTRTDRSQRELVLIIVPTIVGPQPAPEEPTLDQMEKDLKERTYLREIGGRTGTPGENAAAEDSID